MLYLFVTKHCLFCPLHLKLVKLTAPLTFDGILNAALVFCTIYHSMNKRGKHTPVSIVKPCRILSFCLLQWDLSPGKHLISWDNASRWLSHLRFFVRQPCQGPIRSTGLHMFLMRQVTECSIMAKSDSIKVTLACSVHAENLCLIFCSFMMSWNKFDEKVVTNTRGIWKVMHIHPYNFTQWSEKKDEGISVNVRIWGF